MSTKWPNQGAAGKRGIRVLLEDKKHPKKPEFWIYFWGGLVLGAGLGAWISWGMYHSWWAFSAQTGAIALVTGYLAGKWQDPFWPWQNLP